MSPLVRVPGRAMVLTTLLMMAMAVHWRLNAQTPATSKPEPPPPAFKPTPEMLAIQAASEKEHQREMDVLGIKTLRPGVDNDPKSPRAANFDESKADQYPNLPDPLRLNGGQRVTTANQWWTERRR